ncbi:MAG TPA: flavin reductase [Symbiobacteriaceae bacterium]|nr:flavin reductase [Symbiobacteriaceae bacterium]
MEKRPIDISVRHWPVSPLAGPIALLTTVDGQGLVNVAPKSWLSFVAGSPPVVVIGCHRSHHTAANLMATGECVINLPGDDLVEKVWAAHEYREPAPDEPGARGFTAIPALAVAPPRLKECRAHLEGRLESVKWYGDECVLFVQVVAASADEAAFAAPDPQAYLRSIFYLDQGRYGVIEKTRRVGQPDPLVRYVITLIKRPGRTLTAEAIRAHVRHLERLEAEGRLLLCGPFADGEGGTVIIRAESLEAARAVAEADPFVALGLEEYTVRELHLSCAANNHMGFGSREG